VSEQKSAFLVLDDGRIFEGYAWAKHGETFGEAVFTTGMTGYQETLTDPSYHKQIVVMTAPHIGNTGVNPEDYESERIWVSGFVVRNPSPAPSNWRSSGSLEQALIDSDVVGIAGIDTRALTRHIRDRGAMRVGIFSGVDLTREEMVVRVRKSAPMEGAFLAADVSTKQTYVIKPPANIKTRFKVAAIDLGIKGATPKYLAKLGVEVHVMPLTTTFADIERLKPDGVFLSNGPGDPAAMVEVISMVRSVLTARIPLFGICFGHQILGRALGFETYKLPFGHRGINQPVIDLTTGKVEITSHNHGFAVAAPKESSFNTVYGAGHVTHISLNDSVVEGLALTDTPAFSVQYHPESAAGPHDSTYLFERFIDLMQKPQIPFTEEIE
jgi:carbamoyl-phosphate synthase small subunit